MAKPLFDAEALIAQFESATAKQGEQLRKATAEATMAALQGRELTLKNIRAALKTVADAATAGVAKNAGLAGMAKNAGLAGMGGIDPETLLDQAVHGMDDALLKAVDANRTALNTLMAQGADMRDKHLTKAVGDLEKMEDAMFDAIKKAAAGAGAPMASAWAPIMEKMAAGGTLAGAKAATTAEEMAQQMQTAMRSSRAASMRAAQALAESYTAMVSGVLIGMQEALSGKAAKKK